MHDEETYPDHAVFRPERFEDRKRNLELGINPLPEVAFGYGRRYVLVSGPKVFSTQPKVCCRACPGRWLAFDTLWITVASVLAVYDISKAVDDGGAVIEPDTEYTTGIVR